MVSKFRVQVLLIFLFIFSLVFSIYKFPIHIFQFVEATTLKINGVESRKANQLHYFEKNNCADPKNCICTLLIHGLGDFSFTWSNTLKDKDLNNSHFFAVDLPGAYQSPKYGFHDYSPQGLAKLVKSEIMDNCDSWVLVGNSLGGWISIHIAKEDPRVKGILLNSPAGLNKDYSHIQNYFLNPTIEVAKEFYKKAYADPKPLPDFIFTAAIERSKLSTVKDIITSVKKNDFIENPLKLNTKVKLIWGAQDKVIPTDWAKDFQEVLLGAELVIFDKCGHIPQKECFTEFKKELVKLYQSL